MAWTGVAPVIYPAGATGFAVGPAAGAEPDRSVDDVLTVELAKRTLSWHGQGQHGLCKHCMPDAAWPCGPYQLAAYVAFTLGRDEPYGPPETNDYLREVIAASREEPEPASSWWGRERPNG
jgi:hypothetical protein